MKAFKFLLIFSFTVIFIFGFSEIRIVDSNNKIKLSNGSTIQVQTDTINEQNKNYVLNIKYPEFIGLENVKFQNAINQKFKMESKNLKKSVLESSTIKKEKYSNLKDKGDLNYEVTYKKNNIVSLVFFEEQFRKYNPNHKIKFEKSYTFDVQKGKFLPMKDFFTPKSHYKDFISSELKKQIFAMEYNQDLVKPFNKISNINDFYLRNNSFIYYFNEHEFLTDSDGITEFTIPFKDLKNFHLPK